MTATDGGGLSDTKTVTVNVADVNDVPRFASSSETLTTAENQNGAMSIAAASDADGDTLTYTISGADAALFTVSPTTGALNFRNAPDFEAPGSAARTNAYTVIVTARDGDGATTTKTVTVNVADANEAPVFASSSQSLTTDEGQIESLAIAAATDEDADDTLRYTISGDDAALFTVNPTTGALRFISTPDFDAPADTGGDNIYDVSVMATDVAGLSDVVDIMITVNDVI